MPAGYSKTPLAKKLGLKPGMRACVIGAPHGYRASLEPLPENVVWLKRPGRAMDFLQVFATSQAELARRLASLKKHLASASMLWICWPKKASGRETDLSGDAVRATGLRAGLVDVKVCAIDAVWSGLKFVYRLTDRE